MNNPILNGHDNTALKKAEAEYEAFNKTQKITSDFDQEVKKILGKGGDLK